MAWSGEKLSSNRFYLSYALNSMQVITIFYIYKKSFSVKENIFFKQKIRGITEKWLRIE